MRRLRDIFRSWLGIDDLEKRYSKKLGIIDIRLLELFEGYENYQKLKHKNVNDSFQANGMTVPNPEDNFKQQVDHGIFRFIDWLRSDGGEC